MKKRLPKQIKTVSHNESDYKYGSQTGSQHLPDALILSGTKILTGEGNAGLINGIHGHIYESFQI